MRNLESTEPADGKSPWPVRVGPFRLRTGKHLISRTGYVVLIALLVFSALEAYRAQGVLSQRSVEIYQQYVVQDEVLFQLRQTVWQGSIAARDFLLSPGKGRAEAFQAHVAELRDESFAGVERMRKTGFPAATCADVRWRLTEYWQLLAKVPEQLAGVSALAAKDYLQQEIVPRRSETNETLRELGRSNQEVVSKAVTEFARSRQAAGRRIVLMLALCLVLGALTAGFSIWLTEGLERDLLRQYAQMEEAKRELEQLSARLLEIQEEERRRIARELHDEIGQVLTALRIEISRSLTAAAPASEEAGERLLRARELAERAVQTVRNISLLLRPSALDDLGLSPALEWQVQHFASRSGIQCELAAGDVPEDLPDAIKTCIYRVIQEALHNCEKYSAAALVRVRVWHAERTIHVEIEDNGRGMPPAANRTPAPGRGSGLLGMRERIAQFDGTFAVFSEPGRGVRLLAQIPWPPAPDGAEA